MQDTMNGNNKQLFYHNAFCDVEKSVLFEFLPLKRALEIINENIKLDFSKDEMAELSRYVLMKNILGNVSEISLKVSDPSSAIKYMLEYGISGKVLVDGRQILDLRLTKEVLYLLKQNQVNIEIGIFIDGILNYSEDELNAISEFVGKEKLPVYINFLRTLDEAGTLDKTYGKSPARVLEDFGFLDRECYCIGCNFLDKDDAEVLAGYDTEIILTPLADMKLGRGAINLQMLFGQGLKVGLGSGEFREILMIGEAGIALGNTANLMYTPFPATEEQSNGMLQTNNKISPQFSEEEFYRQKEKVEKIIRRIK